MGYGNSAPSADQHLRDKIEVAIAGRLTTLLGQGGNNEDLAKAINLKPGPAVERLLLKIKAVDDVTVESSDAALDAALFNATSVQMLDDYYGTGS